MKSFLVVVGLAGVLVLLSGCATKDSGSREFIPGKGWVPVQAPGEAAPLRAQGLEVSWSSTG
jgi:hypothetical protein